jgi:hypothetical protein
VRFAGLPRWKEENASKKLRTAPVDVSVPSSCGNFSVVFGEVREWRNLHWPVRLGAIL